MVDLRIQNTHKSANAIPFHLVITAHHPTAGVVFLA